MKYPAICFLSLSDLTFYYDLVRFLRQRLASRSLASTYVYYHTYPSIANRRRTPSFAGHLAELDLLWGVPFINRTDGSTDTGKTSYTPEEIELSAQMIRYWSNFVKTGNDH
jgi:carboxylesterase type B